MTIKIKWWCGSGANIHSCLRDEITTDDLGISDDDWRNYSEEVKEEIMRDIALDRLDWGFTEEEI